VTVGYGLGRLRFRSVISHLKKCKGRGSRLDPENRNQCECSDERKQRSSVSLALENPHQALDAYMSFATATARKISCSESSHNPCLRRTRSAYRVSAQTL